MFRIKKDDYNTVQFLPEYKSTTKSKNSTMVSAGRSGLSGKSVILTIFFLIIILAAAAIFVYFTYFSPSKQFISALEAGDTEAAAKICKDNAYDGDFLKHIEPTITESCDKILSDYESGKIASSEAMEKLSMYNNITDKNFDERISAVSSKITGIEEIENSKREIEISCEDGNMTKALQLLIAMEEKAGTLDIDTASYISDILKKYDVKFKIETFNAVSGSSRSKNYDTVSRTLTFMNTYLNDAMITGMLNKIEESKNNDITPRAMRNYVNSELEKLQSTDSDN